MATIKGIKVGQTTINVSYTDGGVTQTAQIATFTVSRVNPELTFSVNSTTLTYDGTNKTLGTVNYTGDGTPAYYISTTNSAPAENASGWVNCSNGTEVNKIPAGTYYVFLKATQGPNYNSVGVKAGNTTGKVINKATGSAGSVSNPAAQNYKEPNAAHTFTIGITGATGTVNYPSSITVTKGGSSVSGWTISGTTVTAPSGTAAGTYTVTGNITVAASDNYNAVGSTSKSWTITVNKVADASVSVTLASNAGTYNSAATLVTAANSSSHGTSEAKIGYKLGAATADSQITWVNVGSVLSLPATAVPGTYYVYYKFSPDENHSNSATYTQVGTLTRSQATGSVTITNASPKYHSNGAVATVNGATGTVHYRLGTSGSFSTSIPTATASYNAGDYTLYYYVDASTDGNYTAFGSSSSPKSVSVSITQNNDASVSVTPASNAGTYETVATLVTAANSSSHGTSVAKIGYKLGEATADSQITWVDAGTALSLTASAAAGTYYIYKKWTADSNHSNSANYTQVGTLERSKNNDASVSVTLASNAGTYNSAATLVAANNSSSHGTSVAKIGYKLGAATADSQITWVDVGTALSLSATAAAGTYYIYKKWTADSNHSNNANYTQVGTLERSKATPTYTAPTAKSNLIYNGSDQTLYNAGSNTTAGSFSYSNGSQRYVGDYTVSWTFTPTDTTNYNSASGSFTGHIGQATPTLTVTPVSHEYTGTAYYATVSSSTAKGTLYWKKGSAPTQSSYGGTVTIDATGTFTAKNITSVTNVADSTTLYWLFVPSSFDNIASGHSYAENYTNTSGNVAMTITATPASVTATIASGTLTYNGSPQTIATATSVGTSTAQIGYKKGSAATADSEITWVNVGTALQATDAGTYYIYKKWTHDANHSGDQTYTPVGTTYTKVINKKACTITASSDSKPYDGSPLTANSATPTGLVSGHQMTSVTVTGTITYAGSVNNVPSAATIKSGTTDVTSNYQITYTNGTLTITKATPTINVQGVTEDYTGGQFWAKVTSTDAKGTLYWKKDAIATSSDTSVAVNSLGTAINITSVVNDEDDFWMYWYFVPSSTANSLASGHTYAENYNTAGGTSSDKVNLVINPRSITNVTASATNVTYNGASQTAVVSISDSGATLTSSDYTISGNTQTNQGTYTITITGQNNYTGTKEISWKINKRNVTVTAGSNSKTYDGTALTENSATASAQSETTGMLNIHHLHSYTVSGSQTLAGSSNNTVTNAKIYNGTHSGTEADVTSNYNITYATGTLTVNEFPVTYKATDQTKVYDGTALSATNTAEKVTSPALPSGHTATFTCTGSVGPAVGSATKTLSGVVIKNSGGTDVTSSFTITKQNGTLTITNATITYTVTSPVDEFVTSTAAAATKTAGNVEITIASASATDYSGSSSGITYSISQDGWSISSDGKTITVPANVNSGTYNITVSASKANHTTKTNGISVELVDVELSNLALTLDKTTVNYNESATVTSVIATYNNGAYKDIKGSLGTAVASNPKIWAGDDTIVTITV